MQTATATYQVLSFHVPFRLTVCMAHHGQQLIGWRHSVHLKSNSREIPVPTGI